VYATGSPQADENGTDSATVRIYDVVEDLPPSPSSSVLLNRKVSTFSVSVQATAPVYASIDIEKQFHEIGSGFLGSEAGRKHHPHKQLMDSVDHNP